jgi:hypothetical protein
MPIEHPLVFYPKYAAQIAAKAFRYGRMILASYRILWRVERDPAKAGYMDLAITPANENELETLALFTETAGGEAEVAKKHRADELRTRLAALEAAE